MAAVLSEAVGEAAVLPQNQCLAVKVRKVGDFFACKQQDPVGLQAEFMFGDRRMLPEHNKSRIAHRCRKVKCRIAERGTEIKELVFVCGDRQMTGCVERLSSCGSASVTVQFSNANGVL